MSGIGDLRRSNRDSKPPELYEPTSQKKSLYVDYSSDEEEDGYEDSKTSNSKRKLDKTMDKSSKKNANRKQNIKSNVLDDDWNESSSPKRPSNSASRKNKSKAKTATGIDNNEDDDSEEIISDELLSLQFFQDLKEGKKNGSKIDYWIQSFESNKVSAIADIINFVLRCAGAEKDWIGSDVNMDGLLPEELDELLREMIEWMKTDLGAKQHILGGTTKSARKTRERFAKFWTEFVHRVTRTMVDNEQHGENAMSILHSVVEQLVSLSSMALMHIREVVTSATMTIGAELVALGKHFEGELVVSRRQLTAEKNKSGTAKAKGKSKLNELQRRVQSLESAQESIESLYLDIFAAVFVHRCQDNNEQIRIHCAESVMDWFLSDPAKLMKTEYLQYLGQLSHDKKETVRRAVLNSLLIILEETAADDTFQQDDALEAFFDNYSERLVELAEDVDDICSHKTIQVLRVALNSGFLDHVDETNLDRIDAIAFDNEAQQRVRSEALSFMLDHTEGFTKDDDDEEADIAPNKAKKAKKHGKNMTAAERKALERRQRTAQQLETLTEFVEYHMERQQKKRSAKANEQNSDGADTVIDLSVSILETDEFIFGVKLADSMLTLEASRSRILRDWPTLTSLLLRESDGELSNTLGDKQGSILLRMFVQSGLRLYQEINTLSSDIASSNKQLKSKKENLEHAEDDWGALKAHLNKCMPALLNRCRDDERNLEFLCKLLPLFEPDSKAVAPLTKCLKQIMDSSQTLELHEAVGVTIRAWMLPTSNMAGQAKGTLASILKTLTGTINSNMDVLQSFLSDPHSVQTKTKSKSKLNKSPDQENAVISLSFALSKLYALLKQVDCVSLMTMDETEVLDLLVDSAELLVETAAKFGEHASVLIDTKIDAPCCRGAQSAISALKMLWYWKYRSFLLAGNEALETEDNEWDENESTLILSDEISNIREKAITVLSEWLNLSVDDGDEDEAKEQIPSAFIRSLERFSFQTCGDIRTLSGIVNNRRIMHAVHWVPSSELLERMRRVFDEEGERLKVEFEKLSDTVGDVDSGAKMNTIATILRDVFFAPLAIISYRSHERDLNRRQAGAAITYLMHKSDTLRNMAKVWIFIFKKEQGVVHYLEVQLAALKAFYGDNVVGALDNAEDAETNDVQEQALQEADKGSEEVVIFAKRLVDSLGVGKLKDQDVASAMVHFFQRGIDYVFDDRKQAGFAQALSMYVRFLGSRQINQIRTYLDQQMRITKDYEELDRESPEWVYLNILISKLSTKDAQAAPAPVIRQRASSPRPTASPMVNTSVTTDLPQPEDSPESTHQKPLIAEFEGEIDDEIESESEEDRSRRVPTSRQPRNDVVMALDFESVHSAQSGLRSEAVSSVAGESAAGAAARIGVIETTQMEVDEVPTSQDSIEESDDDNYLSSRPRRI